MPLWFQNLLVLIALTGCAGFMVRSAYRALQGRKSKLGGCGVCSGCGTAEAKPKAAVDRIVMIPMDSLVRTAARPKTRTNENATAHGKNLI